MFRWALVASSFAVLVSGALAQSPRARIIRANDQLREICAAAYNGDHDEDQREVVIHLVNDAQIAAIRQLFLSLSPDEDNNEINQDPETRRFRQFRTRGYPSRHEYSSWSHGIGAGIGLNFGAGLTGSRNYQLESRILDVGKNPLTDVSNAEHSVIAQQLGQTQKNQVEEPVVNKDQPSEKTLLVQPQGSKILVQTDQQSKMADTVDKKPVLEPVVGPSATPPVPGPVSATTESTSPVSKLPPTGNVKPVAPERRKRRRGRRPHRRHRAGAKVPSSSGSETTTSNTPIIDAPKPEDPAVAGASVSKTGSSGVGNEKLLVESVAPPVDTPIASRIAGDLLLEDPILTGHHRTWYRSRHGDGVYLGDIDQLPIIKMVHHDPNERYANANSNLNQNSNKIVRQNRMHNRESLDSLRNQAIQDILANNYRRSAVGPGRLNDDYNANVNTNVNSVDIGQTRPRRPSRRSFNGHEDTNANINTNVNQIQARRPIIKRISPWRARID